MASDKDPVTSIVPLNITRGLTDKLVEKRKGAALELERMIKEHVARKEFGNVKEIISCLKDDFTLSSNPNSRKGGLVGLAATAIALGRPCIGMNLPELVEPVLACFNDQDPRVRYYACESLYNISKVARGSVLVFFNSMFDGLCNLYCDSDSNVRYGAELLDRLMKDIVSENPLFDVDQFIALLRERMYVQNAFARQFLVSWIIFLDSVPDIHMHEHVPEFIDGLLQILGDPSPQIKKLTEEALGELLKEIQRYSKVVRYEAMANIIANHCQSEDKIIQKIALRWMDVFLELAGRVMLQFAANILVAVLPCLAYTGDKEDIRKVASNVNRKLKFLILPSDDEDTATDLHDQVQMNLLSGGSPTSTTAPGQLSQTPPTKQETTPTKQEVPSTKQEVTPTPSPSKAETTESSTPSKSTPEAPPTNDPNPATSSRPRSFASVGMVPEEGEGNKENKFNLLRVLGVLVPHMSFTEQETKLETLRWLLWLHEKLPKRIYLQTGKLFPSLQRMLTDISDRVLNLTLKVIATLSMSDAGQEETTTTVAMVTKKTKGRSDTSLIEPTSVIILNKYFKLFLVELIKLFNDDRILLESKGSLIIRHLCVFVDAKAVYCTLAEILVNEEKLSFAALMVRELNTILFSSAELFDLRMQLQNMDGPDSWILFKTLYDCWCHNAIATVALCLLSQNYQHAANIVAKFGEIEITSEVLQETDKLVQLLESPIFTFLRLQLLSPHQYPNLIQTLYGLLMLLPQTIAFESLKSRLSSIPTLTSLTSDHKKRAINRQVPRDVDFDKLLSHFLHVQQKHFTTRHTQVKQTIKKVLFEGISTKV